MIVVNGSTIIPVASHTDLLGAPVAWLLLSPSGQAEEYSTEQEATHAAKGGNPLPLRLKV